MNSSRRKPCSVCEERNPDTGRCRKSYRPNQIRNPVTVRFVNRQKSPPHIIKAYDQD
jgi:hypothetical protein